MQSNEDLCRFYLSLLNKDYVGSTHGCRISFLSRKCYSRTQGLLLDLCSCIEEMMTGCKVRK
jgi:hypothetical protein